MHHIKVNRIGFCGDWEPHPVPDEVYAHLRLSKKQVELLIEDVLEAELAKAEDFIKGV